MRISLPHIEEKGWKAVIGFNSQWTPDDDADGCDGETGDDEFTGDSVTGKSSHRHLMDLVLLT